MPCSTVNATNAITSQNVRHSWTAALNSAIAGADVAAGGNGVDFVRLACGTYDLEAGAITVSNGYTRLHADDRCVTFRFAGVGPGLSFSAGGPGSSATQVAYAGVDGVILDGSAMTAGYCVYANDVYWFWETNLYFNNCPGASQVLGFNNAQLEHVTGHRGEGWGLNDYDFESTVWTGSQRPQACGRLSERPWRDLCRRPVARRLGIQRRCNDQPDRPGRDLERFRQRLAVRRHDRLRLLGVDRARLAVSSRSFTGNFAPEFSNATRSASTPAPERCQMQGFANGSRYGYELYVATGPQWKWIGGKLESGDLAEPI